MAGNHRPEDAQPAITYYATLTLAQAAVKTAFQADPGVDGYLQAAQASVLTTNSAAVTTAKNALKTADGL